MRHRPRWLGGLLVLFVIPTRAGRLARSAPLLVIAIIAVFGYTFALGSALPIPMMKGACECASWRCDLDRYGLRLYWGFQLFFMPCFAVPVITAVLGVAAGARAAARERPRESWFLRGLLLAVVPVLPWIVLWTFCFWVYVSVSGIAHDPASTGLTHAQFIAGRPGWLHPTIWLTLTLLTLGIGIAMWTLALYSVYAARREPLNSCLLCGYDLAGLSGDHCPECGAWISGEKDAEAESAKPRIRS